MGASYKGSGNESTLALKTAAVTSDTRGFVEFLQKKCEWLLGRFASPAATHTPAHSDFEARIKRFTPQVLQTTIPAITCQIQTHQKVPNGGGYTTQDTHNPLCSVKRLEGAELYAVVGWCGITDQMMIPDIWKLLYSSATFLTK